MFNEFQEHWQKRKTTLVMTFIMGLFIAIPTYYFMLLIITLGFVIYTILFAMYFFLIIVCWHYLKDKIVYWWIGHKEKVKDAKSDE